MSDTQAPVTTVRYRERLWVPWWWVFPAAVMAGVVAATVNRGVPAAPSWLPAAILLVVAAVVLGWLSRTQVRVVTSAGGSAQLWVGPAHLPVEVIARCAEVPATAKSAAMGRQLDPAAYVMHRAWVGPMVLVVLDDPDDPTPYWLVSTRRPERVLAALRS